MTSSAPWSGASPAWLCRPRAGPVNRPLTPLSPLVTARRRAPTKGQDRFCRRRVNDDSFPDPRRLPSTSAPCPLARREPATLPRALPPWMSFRRAFTPRYALALRS